MKLEIRPAQVDDAADLARIGAATFAMAGPPSTPDHDIAAYIATELTPERFKAHIACQAASLFAAVVDDELVGYLMLNRGQAPDVVKSQRPLQLQRLYVLPQYHGAGVAAALMAQAVDLANAEAFTALWLSVSQQNSRAIRFYGTHGFTVAGEQSFQVGDDVHDDYIMVRHSPQRSGCTIKQ